MSIGGLVYSSYCDANVLKPAIDNLRSIGVATVIAAGNNSTASGVSEPGCISSAIAVGATTKFDTVASYSNSASMMKLWAPGSVIRSSVPGGGYADFNGTSMATPHVAGAFARSRGSCTPATPSARSSADSVLAASRSPTPATG